MWRYHSGRKLTSPYLYHFRSTPRHCHSLACNALDCSIVRKTIEMFETSLDDWLLVLQSLLLHQSFENSNIAPIKHINLIIREDKDRKRLDVETMSEHYLWLRSLHHMGLRLDARCVETGLMPLLELLMTHSFDLIEHPWALETMLSSILILLTCGANPSTRTEYGGNALHLAITLAYHWQCSLKRKKKWSADAEHKVFDFLSEGIVILCSFGSDTYAQTSSSSTPGDFAARSGYLQLWKSSLWYSGLHPDHCSAWIYQEPFASSKESHSQGSSQKPRMRKRKGYSFQDELSIPDIATACKASEHNEPNVYDDQYEDDCGDEVNSSGRSLGSCTGTATARAHALKGSSPVVRRECERYSSKNTCKRKQTMSQRPEPDLELRHSCLHDDFGWFPKLSLPLRYPPP